MCQNPIAETNGWSIIKSGSYKLYKHVISPKYNVRCQGNASFTSPYAEKGSKRKALGYLWTSCERTILIVMPSFPTILKLSQNNK